MTPRRTLGGDPRRRDRQETKGGADFPVYTIVEVKR
jgi:hypothetical protein